MGERTDEIREEIEESGKTPDREQVRGQTQRLKGQTQRLKGQTQRVKGQAQRVKTMGEQSPLGLGIAGAAVGFLAGLLFPSTRMEDERLGQVSDQVKEQAKGAGQEALERGKAVAQEAAQSAKETAKERGQEQQQEVAKSVKEKAQRTRAGS